MIPAVETIRKVSREILGILASWLAAAAPKLGSRKMSTDLAYRPPGSPTEYAGAAPEGPLGGCFRGLFLGPLRGAPVTTYTGLSAHHQPRCPRCFHFLLRPFFRSRSRGAWPPALPACLTRGSWLVCLSFFAGSFMTLVGCGSCSGCSGGVPPPIPATY